MAWGTTLVDHPRQSAASQLFKVLVAAWTQADESSTYTTSTVEKKESTCWCWAPSRGFHCSTVLFLTAVRPANTLRLFNLVRLISDRSFNIKTGSLLVNWYWHWFYLFVEFYSRVLTNWILPVIIITAKQKWICEWISESNDFNIQICYKMFCVPNSTVSLLSFERTHRQINSAWSAIKSFLYHKR